MPHRPPAAVLAAVLAAAALAACSSAPLHIQLQSPRAGAAEPAVPRVHAPDTLTAGDYRRAERLLSGHLDTLIYGEVERPRWTENGLVLYRTRTPEGAEYVAASPAARQAQRVGPDTDVGRRIREALEGGGGPGRDVVVSPDGRLGAFLRDHDLWVRDLETGEEYPVTTDGEDAYGYATNSAGWIRSDRPVVRWSPDSRRLFTFRQDERGVGMMYLTSTAAGHPELDAWRYPLPEDTVIFRLERMVADVSDPSDPAVTFLDMDPDPHRGAVCDHVYCAGTFTDVEWADDGGSVLFLSVSRDHRQGVLRVADAETGEVRDVLRREVDTFLESGTWGEGHNWRYLPETDEVIWWSRETDRGHLFLHDLETGDRKHAITAGDWNVLTVERLDPSSRTLWFRGNAREPGDPYFEYVYSVNI
ncbi:MAG: DPP IV N-terminal domain-containing protein, partial [Gemmatimonadota bacterium]